MQKQNSQTKDTRERNGTHNMPLQFCQVNLCKEMRIISYFKAGDVMVSFCDPLPQTALL